MFLDHFSWWTISNFMPLEFLVVCTSLSYFLNMGLEYICLRCNADTRHFLSIFWVRYEMIFGTRGKIIGGCVSRWMLSLVMNSKVHIQKPIGQWTFWEGMEHSTQTLPRARSGQLEGCPGSRRGFFSLFNRFGKVPEIAGSISQSKFQGQLPGVLVTYLCPYLWMLYNLTVFGCVLGMRVFAATRF